MKLRRSAAIAIAFVAAIVATAPALARTTRVETDVVAPAAITCGHRYMTVYFKAIHPITGQNSIYSEYKIDAHVCWDGSESWAANASQPTITRVRGTVLTITGKGSYLMADGRTTDFWANFRGNLQCPTFPFAPAELRWYPRIKVGHQGGAQYQKGSSEGICYTTTSYVLSHSNP